MADFFRGRRIVLTGASRGIGLETSRLLLKKGARVLGVARNSERLKEAEKSLVSLGDFTAMVADVGRPETAQMIASRVSSQWKALDVLINNAARAQWTKSIEEEEPDLLEKTLRVNVVAPHRLIHALLPCLAKGKEPRIINISSLVGQLENLKADSSIASYKLSKFALNGLTLLYASSLKGRIAVNSLNPGWLKTDMGGPNAPGKPEDGARRILELLKKPARETGKFWYGEEEIAF